MPCGCTYTTTAELSRARHQLVRDGKPVQAGVWGGQAQAEADGSAYLESVRERQREMAREGGARSHVSSSPAGWDAAVWPAVAVFVLCWAGVIA